MSVPTNRVASEILGCDFGFLIRDESIVNRVASPCKLRDYFKAGVRVITSGQIGVINQIPELIKENVIYHLEYKKLLNKDFKELEKLKNWILYIVNYPFPIHIIKEKFVFDNYLSDFKEFIYKDIERR